MRVQISLTPPYERNPVTLVIAGFSFVLNGFRLFVIIIYDIFYIIVKTLFFTIAQRKTQRKRSSVMRVYFINILLQNKIAESFKLTAK